MITSNTTYFDAAVASHEGMTDKQNEDRFLVTHYWLNAKKRKPSTLAVLCDGIGGHRAGEVAAEIGVRTITECVAEGDFLRPLRTLEEAVNRANQAIYNESTTNHGRLGMGTTCACAWVIEGRLYTVSLGDSRIYLLRGDHIIQLTTDHTWIQEALDAGLLTDASQGNHPNAHVIRRYLGSEKPPEPDFRLWYYADESDEEALANQGLRMMPNDILLLCSDGLTDFVSDAEIKEVVQSLPLEQAPDRLISLANSRGGYDNTTVVVLRHPKHKDKLARGRVKSRIVLGCLVGLLVLSALIAAVLWGFRRWREPGDESAPIMRSTTSVPLTDEVIETESGESDPSPTWTIEEDEDQLPMGATRTPWPTNTAEP
ncbi:MAG: PP2C family protein-serine/threonine phosphatase [Brevefilum sp.]